MEFIPKYFPDLNEHMLEQLASLIDQIADWNKKVNLISRKDIDQLEMHHVLHSLSIAKYIQFKESSHILDLGTGGGFPGLPLAILFPEARFTLIDARAKKIKVVNDIIQKLGLKNCSAFHQRAEESKGHYDFVVSRAVAPVTQLWDWSRNLIAKKEKNAIPNGLIALKGGDLQGELGKLPKKLYREMEPIDSFFQEAHFQEKYIVYVS